MDIIAQFFACFSQKLAPARKNSTNWLARLARFCNSGPLADDLSENADIGRLKSDYIYRVNSLLSNFACLSSNVKMKLCQSYCCSFYGSCILNFRVHLQYFRCSLLIVPNTVIFWKYYDKANLPYHPLR